jgi:16S rRNA (cytidine1402-2'-O)-methyltransferase
VAALTGDVDRQKGEFVLIVDAPAQLTDAAAEDVRRTLEVLLEALPVKQAAALAARITGARKNALYDLALEMKRRRGEV